MNPSQRLVLNTVTTYGRVVFAVALMLFSSRWILNALGQTDFGLFSVVGSIIIFITFINNVMSNSVARYYAYSIGQGETEELAHWFNAALSIHLCLATILIMIGWPIGEYAIGHILVVPVDRINTCLWVFRISLISAFVTMISIPSVAMFTAQQRITETAFWGVLQTTLVFGLAFWLTRMTGDLLLFYAVGMVAIIVLIQTMLMLRAFMVFKECRLNILYWFDGSRFKKITSFAIWNLIGVTGATLRDQGSAILLNLHFGPNVNSAYGIAKQVSAQANHLSEAMLGAFSPEVTASEGRGDRRRMINLSYQASKYGTILVLFFAIPLIAEMDYILKLWLGVPPAYTALFCRLILCTFLIDRVSTGYMMAVNARGKIAAYQATVGGSLVLTLPLAWLFLRLGYPPTSVGVAFIITAVVCTMGRVFWMRRLFGEPVGRWIKTVVLPCGIVASAATFAALAPRLLMPTSFTRFVCVSVVSIAVTMYATWFLVFDSSEHAFIRHNFTRFLSKMTQACSRG